MRTGAAATRTRFLDVFMWTPRAAAPGGRPALLTSARGEKLPRPMWILRTVTEGQPELTFRILPGGVKTIGRATGADFIVDAALVSRVHCRLTALPGGELELRDLESTNGTYVNGVRIGQPLILISGDRVKVGRVELVALKDEE